MPSDIINDLAKTFDDIWDSVIGGRPATRLLTLLRTIAPANVVRKVGLPAPGDIPDKIVADVESKLRAGEIPAPTSLLEEIRTRLARR